MKISFYIVGLFLLLFLNSCEDKETEGISRITEYADIQLTGGDVYTLTVGSDYVEPGFVAIEGESDITDDVTVSGSVDASTAGAYTLVYAAKNQDGFEKKVERLVLVVPEGLSDIDLSGTYTGSVALGDFASVCKINKLADGVFYATDFFGGRYAVGFGYGAAYSLSTYFVLKADNSVEALSTNSPWGPWAVLDGVYDVDSFTLSHVVDQDGFGFAVSLIKE